MLRRTVSLGLVIAGLDKDRLAPVATLSQVMSETWNGNADAPRLGAIFSNANKNRTTPWLVKRP
jgi:hypothetical protein